MGQSLALQHGHRRHVRRWEGHMDVHESLLLIVIFAAARCHVHVQLFLSFGGQLGTLRRPVVFLAAVEAIAFPCFWSVASQQLLS